VNSVVSRTISVQYFLLDPKLCVKYVRGISGPALGGTEYRLMPADSVSEIVKFTISIPRESCTNAKAKYSSSVVPPDPSVHFYH